MPSLADGALIPGSSVSLARTTHLPPGPAIAPSTGFIDFDAASRIGAAVAAPAATTPRLTAVGYVDFDVLETCRHPGAAR